MKREARSLIFSPLATKLNQFSVEEARNVVGANRSMRARLRSSESFVCSAKFRSKFCSLSRLKKASEREKKSIDRSSWEFESEFRFKFEFEFEFELMASGENEMERKVAWRHSTRSSWNWFKFNFFLKIRLQSKESLGAKWDFFDGSRKSLSNSLRLDFEFRRPKVLRFANKRAARRTRSFVRLLEGYN